MTNFEPLDFFRNFNILFHDIDAKSGFPKYDIIQKDDIHTTLEIALAGYKKEDIDITVKNNFLKVEYNCSREKPEGETPEDFNTPPPKYPYYIRQEIAKRRFEKQWSLPKHFEVISAEMEDGLLKIQFELRIPESEKPKKIQIQESKLLTQES